MEKSIKDTMIENQEHVYSNVHETLLETKRTVTGKRVKEQIALIDMTDTDTLKAQIDTSIDVLKTWSNFTSKNISDMSLKSVIEFWKENYPSSKNTELIIPQMNAINYHIYSLLQMEFERFNKINKDSVTIDLDFRAANAAIVITVSIEEIDSLRVFASVYKTLEFVLTDNLNMTQPLQTIKRQMVVDGIENRINNDVHGKIIRSFINDVVNPQLGYTDDTLIYRLMLMRSNQSRLYLNNITMDQFKQIINTTANTTNTSMENIEARIDNYFALYQLNDTLSDIFYNMHSQVETLNDLVNSKTKWFNKSKLNELNKSWLETQQQTSIVGRIDQLKYLQTYINDIQNYFAKDTVEAQLNKYIIQYHSKHIDKIMDNINLASQFLSDIGLN